MLGIVSILFSLQQKKSNSVNILRQTHNMIGNKNLKKKHNKSLVFHQISYSRLPAV